MDKHEDILIFLEENISKLVKLKVASRAKYKAYDEHYINYLTAESIDDDIRMAMYREMVEKCYSDMLYKLNTSLQETPELKDNEVVAEYIKQMSL